MSLPKSTDETMIENVLRLLRRGKFELTGEEALAFHQCFSFFVTKLKEVQTNIPTSGSKISEATLPALATPTEPTPIVSKRGRKKGHNSGN